MGRRCWRSSRSPICMSSVAGSRLLEGECGPKAQKQPDECHSNRRKRDRGHASLRRPIQMGWLPPCPDGIAICQESPDSYEAGRTARCRRR
jgi:hypothetical protein